MSDTKFVPASRMRKFLRHGVGCPACGQDAEATGKGVEIEGKLATQEVSCSSCDLQWTATYELTSVDLRNGVAATPEHELGIYGISFLRVNGKLLIYSELREECGSHDCADEFADRMETLEQFILHLAENHVDINHPGFLAAVKEVVDFYKDTH